MKDKQELKLEAFFDTIFPERLAHTNFCIELYDTKVYPVAEHPSDAVRFSLNCLHPTRDLRPVSEKHSPDRPRRADANVIVFRNILVEFDEKSTDEQLEAIIKSHLPYTALTFSGKKSIHVILSLEEPLFSLEAYNAFVDRLYTAVEFSVGSLDPSCRNASNLTRYPDAVRPDTGLRQELIQLTSRVPNETLTTWIEANSPIEVTGGFQEVTLDEDRQLVRQPSRATRALIEDLTFEGPSRHAALKKAVVQLRKSGFEIAEIEEMLTSTALSLIPERNNDLPNLLRWAERNVRVEVNDSDKLQKVRG